MCSCDQRLVTAAFLWEKLPQPQFYKGLTKKIAFFEGWSWFKFKAKASIVQLALDKNLKIYNSEAKRFILNSWIGLIRMKRFYPLALSILKPLQFFSHRDNGHALTIFWLQLRKCGKDYAKNLRKSKEEVKQELIRSIIDGERYGNDILNERVDKRILYPQ